MPARPYRMLNGLVFGKKIDFNEDLSGENPTLAPANRGPQIRGDAGGSPSAVGGLGARLCSRPPGVVRARGAGTGPRHSGVRRPT